MLKKTASLDAHDRVATVGRVGELVLDYVRQGGETVLIRSHASSPWHLLPPIRLDDSGCSYTLLVNPSGGLVGGDHLSIQATLEEGTHVLISSPSANRVYRSLSETSVQDVRLIIGPGARLEWVPELTILFAGARFRQRIHATVAPGGTILLWDAMASGRIAKGERWAFTCFENEIIISAADGQSVVERYQVVPSQKDEGFAESWDYVASLYVIGDAIDAAVWKQLSERAAEHFDKAEPSVLGGISEPMAPGLAIKLVAKSAPDLSRIFEALRQTIRSVLWNIPAPSLRRY